MSAAYLLPQGCQSLLLGMGVDVCADHKGYKVEERHPQVLWQEVLSESQSKW